MFLLILGILSAVGLYTYYGSAQHRFDIASDTKNGGVYILDNKSASINYCDDKNCKVVGNGPLPSESISGSKFAAIQAAIMGGMPASDKSNPEKVPEGMEDMANAKNHKEETGDNEANKKLDKNNDPGAQANKSGDNHPDASSQEKAGENNDSKGDAKKSDDKPAEEEHKEDSQAVEGASAQGFVF